MALKGLWFGGWEGLTQREYSTGEGLRDRRVLDWILLSGVKLNAYPHRAICGRDVAGSALVGTRHTHGGLVGRDPADEVTEVPDQALVNSALRDLLGSVLVHQLSGQHLAVVRAGRSAEGVHVDADERAVGTERRAGGDADDERVFVSGDDQLGRAGQDCVAATEQERVVGRNFVVAFSPLGFLLVQQGGGLVVAGRRRYLVWMMDFEPDGPLAVALFSQEFR